MADEAPGIKDFHGELEPGQRVRITQQTRWAKGVREQAVEGVVMRVGQQRTGSWFAHARDHKLWLDRVELRKDDGELIYLNLDQFSRVEVIDDAAAAG
ncbi:MAG: hypothetical protein AAGB51_13245 [Planctomycetota bacterium]